MRKLVILSFLLCLFAAQILKAQTPSPLRIIQNAHYDNSAMPDAACSAGTIAQLGPHTGQNTSVSPQPIFLCYQDSLVIDHTGDATFMDPNVSTAPGVGYIFYKCPPTVDGPTPLDIQNDPCIFSNPPNALMYVATGQPSGDHLFINKGLLQTLFNAGKPIQFWFAPTTLDDFTQQFFESTNGCANVSVAEAFSVVYLNDVLGENPQTSNNGHNCIGSFTATGGWPEFDGSKRFTIDIALQSDPSVKAVILNPAQQITHGTVVRFTVPVSGTYVITIEDGKSCGKTFTMNMTACNPSNSVKFTVGDANTPLNSNICVPITTQNLSNVLGLNFNLAWDPTELSYTGIQNPNPILDDFLAANNLNENFVANGLLGVVYYDNAFNPLNIPNGQTLFEICFDVLGQNIGDCADITTSNQPSVTSIDDLNGEPLPFIVETGTICLSNNPLVISATPNKTCNAPGSISVNIAGGLAPYNLTFQNIMTGTTAQGQIGTAGGSFTAINLDAGDYRILIADGAQTLDTVEVTLTVNTVGASLAEIQPSCAGKCDGQYAAIVSFNGFNVNAPGPEYSFQWSYNNATTQTISGLCAAISYSVTVTNALENCSAVASATLSQPAPIDDASIQTLNASCTGLANGSLLIAMQGGSPDGANQYDFNWSYAPNNSIAPVPNPAFTAHTNPQALTPIPAGFYYLTVTDSKTCTYTNVIEVEADKVLDLQNVASANPSCAGGTDGALNVQMTTMPNQANSVVFWDYMPQPPTANPVPGALTYSLTGLPANTYVVSAIDADGCSVLDTFIISEPAPIAVTTSSVTNPSCAQPNTGSISINLPTGGTPLYTYRWSTGAVSQNVSGLAAGTYTVTVTDSKNCTGTLTETLSLPASPAVTGVDSVSVKCGADGCLTVNASGSLTYVWTNLTTGSTVGTTAQVCNLAGGNYAYCVADANQCKTCDTLTLGSVEVLAFADTIYQLPQCFDFTDGRIQVVMTGGKSPYTFLWSNGQTNQILLDVAAGTHTVTVTDGNGCKQIGTFSLSNPPDIAYSFTNIAPASCSDVCDGRATITANYATVPPTPGTFSFRWSDNASATGATRTDLCGGIVTVTITDTNNCSKTDEISISAPPPVAPDASSGTLPAKCDLGCDGSAFVAGQGGNGAPFTYDWGLLGSSQTITNLCAGDYTVTIFDSKGCTGAFTASVTDPEPIVVDTTDISSIACHNGSDGAIDIQVLGGNPGTLFYVWTDGTDTIGNTANIDGLAPGRYFVTVTDTEGCTGEAGPFVLNDPPPVEGDYLNWEELLCNGDQTTLYIDTIYGGSGGPYQFSLDYGVTLDPGFPVSMSGGAHIITYYDRIGCTTEDSIKVFEPDPIVVGFNPPSVTIELGDSTELRPLITGAAVDSLIWTPATGLSDPLSLRPYAVTYESQTYTLTIFDAQGCVGTGQIRVEVDPNRNVYLPNIFQPGTSLNARFTPLIGAGVKAVNFMRVYDRWGELMFERDAFFPNNNDFSEGWDGTSRGKRCNPGVYTYAVEVEFLDGRVLLYRGDVTLVR